MWQDRFRDPQVMERHGAWHDRDRRKGTSAGHARFQGFLWGGILLVAGTWFLLQRLGVDLPNIFAALWPIFPFMFGASFLVTYFTGEEKDPGLVWPGTVGTLVGAFFFLFTFGAFDWNQMGELWPVFPLIAGLGFVATWLAGNCRKIGLLVPAFINLGIGVIGLAFTLGAIDARTLRLLWPLALVGLGALMIARALRRAPPRDPVSAESSGPDE